MMSYYPMYGQYTPPMAGIGRIVSNIEEARAAQIPLDGSVSYFPCPAENRVYAKAIGMDGSAVFKIYQQVQEQPKASDALAALTARIEQLERRVNESLANSSNAAIQE